MLETHEMVILCQGQGYSIVLKVGQEQSFLRNARDLLNFSKEDETPQKLKGGKNSSLLTEGEAVHK